MRIVLPNGSYGVGLFHPSEGGVSSYSQILESIPAVLKYKFVGCMENEVSCLSQAKYLPVSILGFLGIQLSSQMSEGIRAQ